MIEYIAEFSVFSDRLLKVGVNEKRTVQTISERLPE
jgi:hypothetical protein